MVQIDDTSGEHFDWLVAGRSRNQKATLDLYKLVETNEGELSASISHQTILNDLVGIAFSLWRAVFLSDLTGDVADRLADAKRFLQSLIAHNAVLYQTDFTAREWAFEYYLDNALFRLARLPTGIMPPSAVIKTVGTAKDAWTNAQAALEHAIATFAEMIADQSSL